MNRSDIALLIADTLTAKQAELAEFYRHSGPIAYFYVDDVLPVSLAVQAYEAFPASTEMQYKNTLRERKYISSQMNRHLPLLEELLFAFQDPKVVDAVLQITQHTTLYPDPMLYAGGISCMERGGYLNPHIDNSHTKDRTRWRALNLLYYVTPEWRAADGGNLELWPHGVKDAPITVASQFNRLVVMATHQHSLHSVSPIHAAIPRCCISNYYFSDQPMHPDQPFHVTSFRGRPEQPIRDVMLRLDAKLRMMLRAIKSSGFFETGHWYRR